MNRAFYRQLCGQLLALVATLGLAANPGQAQPRAASAPDTSKTNREYPYVLPEVPALTFIDAGAPKITRPSTARALATELINGVDSAGRVKQGLAFAVAPWALLGRGVRVSDYQHNYAQYLAANLQLSLGTVRVGGNTGATELGVGLRLTLFDGSDPMRSTEFTDTVRYLLRQALPTYAPQDVADAPATLARLAGGVRRTRAVADSLQALVAGGKATPDQAAAAAATAAAAAAKLDRAQSQWLVLQAQVTRDAGLRAALAGRLAQYRQRWKKTHWNAASLAIAGATGWRLNDALLAPGADNRHHGWSAWATGALPFAGTAGQLLGQVRYTAARPVLLGDVPSGTDGQLVYGVRALFGSASLNLYGEVSGTSHSNPWPGVAKSRADWSAGLEFRTGEGMWVSTGIGHRLSHEAKPEAALIFAGLRLQLASAARFAPNSQP